MNTNIENTISNYERANYVADRYNRIGEPDEKAVELFEAVQSFEESYWPVITGQQDFTSAEIEKMYEDSVYLYKKALDVENNVEYRY